MLWEQLLQCLPNSHPVHTEKHTYSTYACNWESFIWKTEVHRVIGTKLKTFCTFWKLPAVKLGSSYICICMESQIFPTFYSAVPTWPSTVCVGTTVQLQHVKPNMMPPWPKIWLHSTVMYLWPHLTVVMTVTQRITIMNYNHYFMLLLYSDTGISSDCYKLWYSLN